MYYLKIVKLSIKSVVTKNTIGKSLNVCKLSSVLLSKEVITMKS